MKSANIALIFPRLFSRQLGMQRPCAEPWPQAPGSARMAPGTILACAPSISHFRRPCLAVADEGPLPQAPQPQRLQGNAPKTGARKQAQAEYSNVRQVSVKA